jgi:serine/threonine-protein kinase HipA
MTTSEPTFTEAAPSEAYVWVWLPGATTPVVAGRLEASEGIVFFNYGRSYLGRAEARSLYAPELPLVPGRQRPLANLSIAGCINDGSPDAWGQRVIMQRRLGSARKDVDPAALSALTYLLESDSDRFGALDFQAASDEYVDRSSSSTLEEMLHAAEMLEEGKPLSPALEAALGGGSSLGGARPKAGLIEGDKHYIAKFPSTTDTYPVVGAEGAAMYLASRCGLQVAPTRVINCANRDVLLVERFDRTGVSGERRMIVSALTMLELDEIAARHATYWELAELISERFTRPAATLRELFARITFNICVGNTDDHARNHAAFWDGQMLTLTPAYDICPQARVGGETEQAMAISATTKRSNLAEAVSAAGVYGLAGTEAQDIVDHQIHVIQAEWDAAADAARLSEAPKNLLWGRAIMNPAVMHDW